MENQSICHTSFLLWLSNLLSYKPSLQQLVDQGWQLV